MSTPRHVCKGDVFSTGTHVHFEMEVATGDLPLTLRRISGTTAIEATIGDETVLLTGPQVAKFWEMVEALKPERRIGPRPGAHLSPNCDDGK